MKNYKQWKENNLPLANDIKHVVGNSLFAIETNLDPLRRRIMANNQQEALEIVQEIQQSIEKIKEFVINQDNAVTNQKEN